VMYNTRIVMHNTCATTVKFLTFILYIQIW
jgi:hypothetical protein